MLGPAVHHLPVAARRLVAEVSVLETGAQQSRTQ